MASDSAPDGNSGREWSVLLLEDSAMTMVARSLLLAARLGLIAVAVTACATGTSYLTPSGSTTTLVAGWQYRFKLEWSVDPEPGGERRIRGYLTSQYGERADALRVLGQAFDSSGAVVGQRIAHVPGGVTGFARAYFEIPRLPPADHYLVSVWDYTLHQSPSIIPK